MATNFLDLPVEVIEHIFGFIAAEKLASVALASKQLHSVVLSEDLWRSETLRRFGAPSEAPTSWREYFIQMYNFGFFEGVWSETWADVYDKSSITVPSLENGLSSVTIVKKGWNSITSPSIVNLAGTNWVTWRMIGGWSGMQWDYYVAPMDIARLHPSAKSAWKKAAVSRNALALMIHRNVGEKYTGEGLHHWFVGALFKPPTSDDNDDGDGVMPTHKVFDKRPVPYLFPDIRDDRSVKYKRGAWNSEPLEWPDGARSADALDSE
jgi:hypothetical protein